MLRVLTTIVLVVLFLVLCGFVGAGAVFSLASVFVALTVSTGMMSVLACNFLVISWAVLIVIFTKIFANIWPVRRGRC